MKVNHCLANQGAIYILDICLHDYFYILSNMPMPVLQRDRKYAETNYFQHVNEALHGLPTRQGCLLRQPLQPRHLLVEAMHYHGSLRSVVLGSEARRRRHINHWRWNIFSLFCPDLCPSVHKRAMVTRREEKFQIFVWIVQFTLD